MIFDIVLFSYFYLLFVCSLIKAAFCNAPHFVNLYAKGKKLTK